MTLFARPDGMWEGGPKLDRVALVQANGRTGSGYLIAPELVLTAAHVVDGASTAGVTVVRGTGTHDCTVVWRRVDKECDAALLKSEQPLSEKADTRPVVWATLKDGALTSCRVMGFPRVAWTARGEPDTELLEGRLAAGAGVVKGRYELNLHAAPRKADDETPWAGLSGAPVFVRDGLVGVVVAAPLGWDNRRLEAIRGSVLLTDKSFKDAVTKHTKAPLVSGRPPSFNKEVIATALKYGFASASLYALLQADVPPPKEVVPVIGSPHLADPCALVSVEDFERFGSVWLDPDYGGFDRCDVIVSSSAGNSEVEIDVEISLSAASATDLPQASERVGRIGISEAGPGPDECTRGLVLPRETDPGKLVWINVDGSSDVTLLCEMADRAAHRAAETLSNLIRDGESLPHRSPPLPETSLVHHDACELIDSATLVTVADINPESYTADFANWGCEWVGDTTEVMLGFTRNDPLTSDLTQFGDFVAQIEKDAEGTDSCVALLEYRRYEDLNEGDRRAEMVYVDVTNQDSSTSACTMAEELATAAAEHLPAP